MTELLTGVGELAIPDAPPHPYGRFRDNPRAWLKTNLFGSPINSVFTIVFTIGFAYILARVVKYVFISGRWDAVRGGLTSLMVGLNYPRDTGSLARPWIAVGLFAAIGGLATGVAHRSRGATSSESARPWIPVIVIGAVLAALTRTPTPKVLAIAVSAVIVLSAAVGARLPRAVLRRLWIVYAVGVSIAAFVLTKGDLGAKEEWGGLLLALYVASFGIVLSFPLGLLLALGRRSRLPVVRTLSVVYIEMIRGVPLITLLFAGDLALRFFLPVGSDPPGRVMRAIIMIVLFSAAYIAEIVRGGLQSVSRGQMEAAQSLSLGPITTLRKVVLPQALRTVLPAIVGQFISLFKDTTLLTIIGLHELVGVAETITSQPKFRNQGYLPELLTFVGLLFWVCCYSMSKASRRLETRMGVGVR
ncbi:MAG: amino acid ABC transporter permease [Ilumatobacteraceae bacterium]